MAKTPYKVMFIHADAKELLDRLHRRLQQRERRWKVTKCDVVRVALEKLDSETK